MFDNFEKIRCPKCEWHPTPKDEWQCYCDHIWNTFLTHGECPKCKYTHLHTQCLSCHKTSPHVDWYLELNEIDIEIALEIEIEEEITV